MGSPVARASRDVDVLIGPGSAFSPAFVAVEVGDTVRWTHQDAGQAHTVTAQPGQDEYFDSSPNAKLGRCAVLADDCMYETGNNTYEHTFMSPGTYNYYCKLHGRSAGDPARGECEMCGQVRVNVPRTDSASPSPSQSPTHRPTASPSPSASPSASESPSPSPGASATVTGGPIAAGEDGGGGAGGRWGVALLAVAVLGGLGWIVWRRLIAEG